MGELKYSRLDLAMGTLEYYLDKFIIGRFAIEGYSYKINDDKKILIPDNNDEVYTFLENIGRDKRFKYCTRYSISVDLKKDDLEGKKLTLKKIFNDFYVSID